MRVEECAKWVRAATTTRLSSSTTRMPVFRKWRWKNFASEPPPRPIISAWRGSGWNSRNAIMQRV